MPGRLPIVDVAVTGIARILRSLPMLLGFYWLPWLLGTIALVLLDVFLQNQLRLGWAPEWAREIVWAPFSAMLYLKLLRWWLDGHSPRGISVDTGQETWIAALVMAAWSLLETAVSHAPISSLGWLVQWWGMSAYEWREAVPYYLGFQLAAWLINCALLACFFGLVVGVAKSGWPDPRALWRLLRLRPVRLFCIAVLATAAVGGLQNFGSQVLAWLGAYKLAPSTLVPWRPNIHWALLAHLPHFPQQFLTFAIEASILAEAYRRLLLIPAQGQSPAARP